MNYSEIQKLVSDCGVIKLSDCILKDLKSEFSFIKTIEAYEGQFGSSELKKKSSAKHAIYLSVINLPSSQPSQRGDREFTVTVNAYVLATSVPNIPHAKAAIAISTAIAKFVQWRRWKNWVGNLSHARDVKINKVVSADLEKNKASVVVLSWSHNISVGVDHTANPEGTPDRLTSVGIGTATLHGEVFDGSNLDG